VLAQLYESGRGVDKDPVTATKWFATAARAGHILSEVEYAIRLFNGVGVQPSETAAAAWFQRAADVGNPIAQDRLARLLATGRGIKQDPVAAAKYYILAKNAGRTDDFLDQFFSGLTDDQRQAALTAAQRWPAG
jgi:TPR repeat protein